MAFGDRGRQQNVTDYNKDRLQNEVDNYRNSIIPQGQNFWNQYLQSSGEGMNDYRGIMDQYKNFAAANPNVSADRVGYNRSSELGSALSGYQDFANTGGFSNDDIANMRARGISPIRAVYQNAQNELARNRNLQGGYSPNYAASLAKLTSGRSQQAADAAQNVEANLAQMRQQGRLAGLSGLGNLSVADTQFGQQAQLANQSAGLQAAGLNSNNNNARLGAIQGQANLFGTSPGMANSFASNLLNSNNQWAQANNQQAGIADLAMRGQQQVAATPSNFGQALNYGSQIGGIAAQVAAPFFGVPPTSPIPSSRVPGASSTYNSFPGVRT